MENFCALEIEGQERLEDLQTALRGKHCIGIHRENERGAAPRIAGEGIRKKR